MLHFSWKLTNCYGLLFLCNPKIETAIIPFSEEHAYVRLEDIINNNERCTKGNVDFFSLLLQCVFLDSNRPNPNIQNLSDIIRSFSYFHSFSSTHPIRLYMAFVHAVPLHHFQLSPKTYFNSCPAPECDTRHICTQRMQHNGRTHDDCMRKINATVAEQHPTASFCFQSANTVIACGIDVRPVSLCLLAWHHNDHHFQI